MYCIDLLDLSQIEHLANYRLDMSRISSGACIKVASDESSQENLPELPNDTGPKGTENQERQSPIDFQSDKHQHTENTSGQKSVIFLAF